MPNSGDKFMTRSVGNLKFIDSYQFIKLGFEKSTECVKSETGDPYEKIMKKT